MDYALEKGKARKRRAMWITLGSLIALIAIIAIGVGVGVSQAKKNNDKNSSANASSGSSNSNGNGNGGGSNNGDGTSSSGNGNSGNNTVFDPNDPSNFAKDARLHKSFYGMAYTPENSQYPACGNSLQDVIKDIQLISQLTTRIRLYGADCNQTGLVLEAIKQTKVEMQVFLGNYVVPDDPEAYTRQRDVLRDTLMQYGTDNIAGLSVGNEFMLNYLNGGTDPNSVLGNQGAALLIADIEDTRQTFSAAGFGHIEIGTSDAGSYFNTRVLESVDYALSNVHAWFAETSAEDAAKWVFDFFESENEIPAAALANKPKMYIAETGWPTSSSDAAHATNGGGTASVAGLQTFMDTFVCQANSNGVGYFFFEFFDEEWKDVLYGGVEGHWGLFTKERELKDVIIPNCTSP